MVKTIQVAVGVIWDCQGQVLIAWRDPKQDQGGCWEFPGGKVEAGETVSSALIRELCEEVGLSVRPEQIQPWMTITHDYGQKIVELAVCHVLDVQAQAQGLEGQEVRWASVETVKTLTFPKANQRILAQLKWPQAALN